MTVVDDLKALLCHDLRPAGSMAMFSGVDVQVRDGALVFKARILSFDDNGARDIKEQDCSFGDVADYDDDARNRALCAAFAVVVTEALTAMTPGAFEVLMPVDFVPKDLATLGNCETQADFEKALRAQKRLGKHLP